jgi:hypothetical protein
MLIATTTTTVVAAVMAVSGCARLNPHQPAAAPASAPGSPGTGNGQGSTGDGGGGLAPGSPPPTSAGPTASTAAVLPDGRSASYLKSVDVSKRTVTFDLIQMLFGKDAAQVWVKKHPDEPDGPPEGYLIINDNSKLRTITFAADVTVKIVNLNAPNPSITQPISLADLPHHLAGEKDAPLPYWLTVEHGEVTLVEEEYLA